MKTIIYSNGSKLAGDTPDSIEKLVEVLKGYDLDLEMFACLGFVKFLGKDTRYYRESKVSIQGNFKNISHVFHIEGLYADLEHVIKAIEKNIAVQCDAMKVTT